MPPGIPGMGDDIEIAIQQAPQYGRHFTGRMGLNPNITKILNSVDYYVARGCRKNEG
ncbi:MAG: hypothetical protein WBJ37_09250 [Bacteroidales bacterium]